MFSVKISVLRNGLFYFRLQFLYMDLLVFCSFSFNMSVLQIMVHIVKIFTPSFVYGILVMVRGTLLYLTKKASGTFLFTNWKGGF